MAESFYEKPVLNSPYEEPRLHHRLDDAGQPVDGPPETGRRRSELISPVPRPRLRRQTGEPEQVGMTLIVRRWYFFGKPGIRSVSNHQ
jgi:type III restriction enzyme